MWEESDLTGRGEKVVCSFCYWYTVKYTLKCFWNVAAVTAVGGAHQLLSARMVSHWPDRVFLLRKNVEKGLGKSCLVQEMQAYTSGCSGCDMWTTKPLKLCTVWLKEYVPDASAEITAALKYLYYSSEGYWLIIPTVWWINKLVT